MWVLKDELNLFGQPGGAGHRCEDGSLSEASKIDECCSLCIHPAPFSSYGKKFRKHKSSCRAENPKTTLGYNLLIINHLKMLVFLLIIERTETHLY